MKPPIIGTRVAYMGYWIEHAWFDSAVGPDLKNSELAFSGGVHKYEMGRLDTPFYDEGIIRLMCYYPQNGVLRRRMMVPGSHEPHPDLVESAVSAYTRHNYPYSSPDREYHFHVDSGPEGAILSGRWCPIEIIGVGNGEEQFTGFLDLVFNEMCAEIRKGGGPFLIPTPVGRIAAPKWNQYWSTTADAWLFAGDPNDPNMDDSELENGERSESLDMSEHTNATTYIPNGPVGSTLGNTAVNFENAKGIIPEIIHAPQPSYSDDEEETFGFIGGGA